MPYRRLNIPYTFKEVQYKVDVYKLDTTSVSTSSRPLFGQIYPRGDK